jgi:hypothetical protein
MLKPLTSQNFNCTTDYALDRLNSIRLDQLEPWFNNLPTDPYLEGNYRQRRLSRFKVSDQGLQQLPHRCLFQSKTYNPLLGDVVREFEELEPGLIELEDFQRMVLEFYEFCKLCSSADEVGVHQIRTIAYPHSVGHPAPEGIHRDGVDLVAIFCVHRSNIEGGETYLYQTKDQPPVFQKILNPGELIVFNDHQFLHFTSAVNATQPDTNGLRDVFVLTCPGLVEPD